MTTKHINTKKKVLKPQFVLVTRLGDKILKSTKNGKIELNAEL